MVLQSSSARIVRAIIVPMCCAVAVIAAADVSYAAAPLPKPGTPAQVAALVGASRHIQQLPSAMVPDLSQVAADNATTYFPTTRSGCLTVTQCVFGVSRSATTVVLFGDSHALMWLPSLVPVATSRHLRLVLLWKQSCPAAVITVWNPSTRSTYTSCDTFRRAALAALRKLAPSAVLLSDRTTSIFDRNNVLTTDAAWLAGLETTIGAIASRRTKVAVVGDVTPFSALLPECLAANPNRVQSCSTRDPNPAAPGHFAAEQSAAKAKGVPYLNPNPMLCTSVCSPIIGRYVAYFDSNHVSATYASFLSADWTSLLQQASLIRG